MVVLNWFGVCSALAQPGKRDDCATQQDPDRPHHRVEGLPGKDLRAWPNISITSHGAPPIGGRLELSRSSGDLLARLDHGHDIDF